MTDLFQMEEIKNWQRNPGVRDMRRHSQLRLIIKFIRKRVEHDAASDNPQLTRENQEIIFEMAKLKWTIWSIQVSEVYSLHVVHFQCHLKTSNCKSSASINVLSSRIY